MREDRGTRLPRWPEHVYVPIAGGMAVATDFMSMSEHQALPMSERLAISHDAMVIAALGAWRMTKGIYRFDTTLRSELWGTPVSGDVPVQVLHRLPEWCVYLDLDLDVGVGRLHGAWVHLEVDDNTDIEELRFLLDLDDHLQGVPVHLGGTLSAGLDRALAVGVGHGKHYGMPVPSPAVQSAARQLAEVVVPLTSLVLYLCSERPDIDGRGQPGNPTPKRVKGGTRLFAADGPRRWDVGLRIGAALRTARERASTAGDDSRQGPRPHVRRAHYHTYWTGPRTGKQTPVLRWLPPIPVGLTDEELPAILRRVR